MGVATSRFYMYVQALNEKQFLAMQCFDDSFSTDDPDGSDHLQRAIIESLTAVTTPRQSELSLAIEASRLSAGMKCCYGCGEWTMNPMRSSSHKDCPHVACSLKCLVHMENDHVTRKIEMCELDESFGVSSSASATSNGCIATCTLSRGRSRSSRRGRSRSPRPRRG